MKAKETSIKSEISKFKADKDIEFTKARDKIVNEKKEQWQKEITELRKLMEKKCSRDTNAKKPLISNKQQLNTNKA